MPLPRISAAGRLHTPGGWVEYVVEGVGEPVTVVGHGLAKTIPETRPFLGGTEGSRAYLHFRGHGGSPLPRPPWSRADLVAELRVVADHTAATRGVGVSMSCGLFLDLVLADPARFERLVLVLPPALLDEPGAERPALARPHRTGPAGLGAVVDALTDAQPSWMNRIDPRRLAATSMARELIGRPELFDCMDALAEPRPGFSLDDLAAVEAPVLIVGQEDDRAHPLAVAEDLAAAFPRGTLRVIGECPSFAAYTRRIGAVVAEFLDAGAGRAVSA
ncbi:alpha/beta hydrolase [Actinosynnema sp. NPDC047251]|uniref:AB hydrolase-1 domain-containing protein n=1 Tax=Saccharothrix espanaensis (strain ATCC 51144 / DSM 44229 / JCM 9112 / NBRC 15066 / NRRL 15764) TaxID=1179773 RepID=K0JWY1_SACES|nr:alpha/beta hydrolase [Saccharothrix espanaensis]CCH32375.1 hypothetical protein BN6_51090 [Saccharothrix espanaensis DSM 44229]